MSSSSSSLSLSSSEIVSLSEHGIGRVYGAINACRDPKVLRAFAKKMGCASDRWVKVGRKDDANLAAILGRDALDRARSLKGEAQ